MDAGSDGQGKEHTRKGLQSHAVQKWTTSEVVVWLEEQNLRSTAAFAKKEQVGWRYAVSHL